jgi:ATP-binding cassette subfamily B protein
MWNRQREAEEARERLARAGEEQTPAPNRNPPQIDEPPPIERLPADAAE